MFKNQQVTFCAKPIEALEKNIKKAPRLPRGFLLGWTSYFFFFVAFFFAGAFFFDGIDSFTSILLSLSDYCSPLPGKFFCC